jgi:hypothetical protein
MPCGIRTHNPSFQAIKADAPDRAATVAGNCHVLRYEHEVRSSSTPHPNVRDFPNLPRDTQVKVILVNSPLLIPVAQKLCRCEHGVFTIRTCVHSRTLLRIEIVWYCS